jgi:hypothetical protein
MGSSVPKAAKKRIPEATDDGRGLWVDSRVLARHLKQPSHSMLEQPLRPSTERMLHFADLVLGAVKPDKFKPEKVSKKR